VRLEEDRGTARGLSVSDTKQEMTVDAADRDCELL